MTTYTTRALTHVLWLEPACFVRTVQERAA